MPDTRFSLDLDGRVAVVTGGSSGIGRAICGAYAQHGATVVVADLQPEPREGGTPIVDHINDELGGTAVFVECDVTERSQIDDAVSVAREHGGVQVMVSNAGVFAGTPLLETGEDDFDRLMDINVKGLWFCAQAAAREMIESGNGGSIINLSSVAGLRGVSPFSIYSGTKGAVRLMTYALAEELGEHGIRVNAIHPGVIETTMTTSDVALLQGDSEQQFLQQIPLGRFGGPDDIAGVALYLASDLSTYVSGASLVVDGGLSRF
jgi:NAD(P)-dependent dehydrogenase (short-subunit alcohol dehydrogenase family)